MSRSFVIADRVVEDAGEASRVGVGVRALTQEDAAPSRRIDVIGNGVVVDLEGAGQFPGLDALGRIVSNSAVVDKGVSVQHSQDAVVGNGGRTGVFHSTILHDGTDT